ncbi:MAG: DUF1616 domain-containing protein, partial [Dehalococcoidia bacterium]
FPRRGQIDGLERAALSLGLSIASVTLLGLLLNYTPWGLRLEPMAVALGLLVAVAGAAALIARHLSGHRRFHLTVPGAWRRWSPQALVKGGLVAALILAAVAGATWAFYSHRYAQLPQADTGFTQFYILGSGGLPQDYPQRLRPGQKAMVQIAVENNEGRDVSYRVRAEVDGQPLATVAPFAVASGATWQRELKFVLNTPEGRRKVEFSLYREVEVEPYRSLHLWVDVQAPLHAREVQ